MGNLCELALSVLTSIILIGERDMVSFFTSAKIVFLQAVKRLIM